MSGISIPVLASSVFFTAFAAFGAGYLLSPPVVRDNTPIVDPEAWNRTAPVAPVFEARTTAAQADIAMQAAADDLNQRGWIEPADAADLAYHDDVAYQDETRPIGTNDGHDSGSYAVESLDGGGDSDKGSTTIIVLDKADADRAWSDQSPAATQISVSQ